MSKNYVFDPNLGTVSCESFSEVYPEINKYIVENREWETCRDGNVKEILDFKTIIKNPYRRVVGGYNRNINPFFLLAEAMWIFTGRKDVKFLSMFNKNMEKFSDDGKVFHAPYGFRLRHWGVRSEDKFCEENLHAAQGYDQIADAIRIFDNNPNTRQVVLSIWNPDLDLGTKTKDIPCNDIIMMKIRNSKLITTIQNRSNDLHWGLPTNIFQFSFMTEIISACLGIELGTQTHNSQSLHIYDWNNITDVMYNSNESNELYSEVNAHEYKIDLNFSHSIPANRLREVDYHLNVIIDNLEQIGRGKNDSEDEIQSVKMFSEYLYRVYMYLKTYLVYKVDISVSKDNKDKSVKVALNSIEQNSNHDLFPNWDIYILAKNWFTKKLSSNNNTFMGKL